MRLLVVAGEASGDRAAAGVVDALGPGVSVVAVGGAALAARGATMLSDLRGFTAMGFSEVARRAGSLAAVWRQTTRSVERESFDAALLVGFSELNVRLLPRLRRARIPAVFYGPPQAWAWREGRAAQVTEGASALCVMLPFEEAWWRTRGADAMYVGHPAMETARIPRTVLRDALGLTQRGRAIAVLPGSRPHEVRALAAPMLEAYARVREEEACVDARVIVSSSLDVETAAWLAREAEKHDVALVDADPRTGASELLGAFDLALTASGTASLEAAVAGAIPVVAYKVSLVTEAIARVLVEVRDIALPNIVLGRRAFAEHVQRDASAKRLAESMLDAIERIDPLRASCSEVARALGPRRPSAEVARVILERAS